ncbi:FAD/NAD(P)-binding domain-containing protein [Hypomontagnella monticulosa]|nr:FAD/NAD(P)-binding domain-containing protein [Hypomontagnella monticulosa]
MESGEPKRVDAAIIGAGICGLVAARSYLRLRPEANVLILDSDKTVGGVWSKDRLYPALVTQTELGLFNYSDMPMAPKNWDGRKSIVTGQMVHDYLHKYSEEHDLLRRIRFNSFVTSAKQCARGWRLELRDSNDIIEAEKLIVAPGYASIPNIPQTFDDASIPIIHSRDLGASLDALQDAQKVIVVGAAKSGFDATYTMLKMGKEVEWVIRPDGSGPMPLLPFKIGFLWTMSTVATRFLAYMNPSIFNTSGLWYWLLQRNPLGRWCVDRFWDFLAYVSGREAGYGAGDHIALLKPDLDHQGILAAPAAVGLCPAPDFWPTLHSKNLHIARDAIRTIKEKTIYLKSGETTTADCVIMCTGWGDHLGMFDAEHKTKIGIPVDNEYDLTEQKVRRSGSIDWSHYDEAAEKAVDAKLPSVARPPKSKHPELQDPRLQKKWRLWRRVVPVELAAQGDRSLVLLGQMTNAYTPVTAEVQAFWAVVYLLGELDVPDMPTMATEVAEFNAFTRKRYFNQGQRSQYALWDYLNYIGVLFGDLGLNSYRKSNAFAELFSPYRASDFNGFVDEYLEKRELKRVGRKL